MLYTPQQNGAIERKHRHIVEHALSILSHPQAPFIHWDDIFSTSVYLINITLSASLQYKTPLEILTGKRPNFHRLKTFGCLCNSYLRPYTDYKLENKSERCVFLGYSSQYKGYIALLPDNKIIITRHMFFNEQSFPFSTNKLAQSTETSSSLHLSHSLHFHFRIKLIIRHQLHLLLHLHLHYLTLFIHLHHLILFTLHLTIMSLLKSIHQLNHLHTLSQIIFLLIPSHILNHQDLILITVLCLMTI